MKELLMYIKDIAHDDKIIFDTETAQRLAVTPHINWSKAEHEYILKNILFRKEIQIYKNLYDNYLAFKANPNDISKLFKKELTDIAEKDKSGERLSSYELAVQLLLKGNDQWDKADLTLFENNKQIKKEFIIIFSKYKLNNTFYKMSSADLRFKLQYHKDIVTENTNNSTQGEENVVND